MNKSFVEDNSKKGITVAAWKVSTSTCFTAAISPINKLAGKIPPKDEAPPLKPVELERPSTDPDDGSPFDDGDPSNDLPPNFSQLWREWGALFKQTTRFAKKLAWAAADLSKKLKKK